VSALTCSGVTHTSAETRHTDTQNQARWRSNNKSWQEAEKRIFTLKRFLFMYYWFKDAAWKVYARGMQA
jgi:hypothetical protein